MGEQAMTGSAFSTVYRKEIFSSPAFYATRRPSIGQETASRYERHSRMP